MTTAVSASAQRPSDEEMLEAIAGLDRQGLADLRKRLTRWANDPATRAFDRHLNEHGCGRPPSPGFSYCDEAMALFNALRPENKVIVGGGDGD